MTESGTPPPRGDHSPILPAAGRPPSEGEIPRELFGFMRDASQELIEFEPVAQGGRLGPLYGREYDRWARASFAPAGVVRGETNTSLLPKALGEVEATPLPKVVVREAEGTEQDAVLVDAAVLSIPAVGDELFVGGPEPADWVRLPDARTAPTEPSLRRRVQTALRISPDAPTPIEPNPERRRERLRKIVALSIGAFVAVIGLSSLLVTSLVSDERLAPLEDAPVRAIEAARTATFPDDIPPPPPEPASEADEAAVVSEARAEAGALAVPPPAPALVPTIHRSRPPAKDEPAPSAFGKPMAPASPAARKPERVVRVQSGLARSSAAPSGASLPRASSASSTQPKKRLWFPPE